MRLTTNALPVFLRLNGKGKGIVALCSKTYYCWGATDKFSCKGINKQCYKDIITKELFTHVLRNKESVSATNKGFRVKDNGIFTYTQSRAGFTYFYPKRKVLEDGVSTIYLDI